MITAIPVTESVPQLPRKRSEPVRTSLMLIAALSTMLEDWNDPDKVVATGQEVMDKLDVPFADFGEV